MTDQDLGGDSLKVVRYRIVFTKRDYEVPLYEDDEVINYPTNGGSFGGLKVAEFFGKVRDGDIPRPQLWKELNYPSADSPDTKWELPTEDLRYIKFIYEVIRHLDKEDREYDKEQVRVLGDIGKTLRDKL